MSALRTSRNRLSQPSIMIAPLVDLIFTLLIFFMLVSTYITPSIKIELPRSISGQTAEKRAVTIIITRAGDLFFEGKPLTESELRARILELDAEKIVGVRIRADKNVSLQTVVSIIDIVRESRVKSVELEVRGK